MKISPHLSFNGQCEAAMNHYAVCLNGKIESIMYFRDAPGMDVPEALKNQVLHSVLLFGDNCRIMASDSNRKVDENTDNISLSVEFDSLESIESAFTKLSEGGKITMPLGNSFWNARFGMCTDKFGISWMLNYQLPKS